MGKKDAGDVRELGPVAVLDQSAKELSNVVVGTLAAWMIENNREGLFKKTYDF